LHRALREAADHAALRRVLLGTAAALIFSACQTPFGSAVLHEQTSVPAPVSPAIAAAAKLAPAKVAPPRVDVPAARDVALARPHLAERLAELLVQHAPDLTPVDRARVASAIQSAQQAHQLDPLLVLAIIEQESDFDPKARGTGGSMGLMQVRPFVARDIAKRHGIPWTGPRTLLDPAANVSIGACYLGEMFEMYPDPALAIAAYNLGPYRVQRFVSRGHHPRPKYLLDVLARYQVFSSEFGPLAPEDIEDADAE
jgi:soluble lytic murein transglycosylase-like protein